jgi:peptidoglycan glycosyltransferase
MVPASHNDFIFSSIGEELGLMGATAVLAAFVLLVGAGMRTALRTTKDFEKLLAAGLTTILGVQAFIIVGGVLRVVPLTGVTLPFMSYGGSSLVANYVLLALLVRISDATARELREVPVPAPVPAGAARAWARAGRRQAEQRGQQ